ncbi:MAG: autotransporter domain-containing protein [Planctomycetia bacterium]|nr:autotransporter domain-containing protein [Planctomycetia bacterium]
MKKSTIEKASKVRRKGTPIGQRGKMAITMALAAVLFGAGNAWAEDGYLIKNDDETTHYASLFEANPSDGDLVIVAGGNVEGGGAIEYTSSTSPASNITLRSDDDNVVRKIDAGGTARLFYSDVSEFALTLNIANLEFTNGNGTSGGLIYTPSSGAVTINGSNAFFTNSHAYGGGVLSAGVVNISGSNTFTNNVAEHSIGVQGGAIYASSNIVLEGKQSTAIFSGNTVTVGSTTHRNDIYAENNITIKDGGRYSFDGGITTGKDFDTFTIQDGSNVIFGTNSITTIQGKTLLDNAHLTIQGSDSTTFDVGRLEIGKDSQNSIVFESTYSNEGRTVMEGENLVSALTQGNMQMFVKTTKGDFAYIREISGTQVIVNAVEEGTSTFNLVRGKGLVEDSQIYYFVGWSKTFGGHYYSATPSGTKTILPGDRIVVTADGYMGTSELPKFGEDFALSIQSNTNEVRTITAETKTVTKGYGKILTGYGKITLNLSQIKFDNDDVSNTGAFIVSNSVVVNGSGEFANNDSSGDSGGAITADDAVELNGTIQFMGEKAQTGLAFTNNRATSGGAISGNSVTISGSNLYVYDGKKTYANTFTGNEISGGSGGAVYASASVSLSGSNLFDKNVSESDGGAIYSGGTVSVSGENKFTDNKASTGQGGAIWAASNVTFSDTDSTTTFAGNTANGVKNDVFSQNGNITFSGGTYILGGGLVADGNPDDKNSGIINVTGGAYVNLEDGTISSARNLVIDNNATLDIDLNANNKVSALNAVDVADGATELFLSGTGSINEGNMDVYLEKTDGMTNGYYLVAAGNFSGNDTSNVTHNSWDFAASRISATDTGLYLGVLLNGGAVLRSDASGTLNAADTFDAVFEDGLGAVATGNVITISNDVHAENAINLNADVNELTIQSDDSAQRRTITATGITGHRFLNFEGDCTVNTTNIIFENSGTDLVQGGAIFSNGNLTINGTTEFKNNQAELGGAIYAVGNVTFAEGSHIDFSGNTMGSGENETPNDLYVAPTLGGSSVITIEKDAIVNFHGGIDCGAVGNTSLVIDQGAHVTFSDDATVNISGEMHINSSDVTFGDDVVMDFQNGVIAGVNVSQSLSGNVSIAKELGATFDLENNSNSSIDLRDASNVTISEDVAVKIYDDNGNVLSAKDFKGKLPASGNTWTLIYGKNDALANVGGEDVYESLLYKVQLGLDGQNFVIKSEKKDLQPSAIERNAEAARQLFGDEIFDVKTEDEARLVVSGATGEIYASTANAQVQRLNYLNTMLVNRLLGHEDSQARVESTVRGQCAEHCPAANLWASGYGIGGFTDMDGSYVAGYDYKAGGMLAGADWQGANAQWGLFCGYGQTGIDAANADVHSKDTTLGGYLLWDSRLGGGYTTLLGNVSLSDVSGTRTISADSYANKFDARQSSCYLEKGWKYENNLGVMVNPYGVLQYIGYNADATGDDVLAIDEVNYDSLRTKAGVRLDRNFCRNGNLWTLSSGFAWNHELLDTSANFIATTNFGGQPVAATIFGNEAGRDWFEYTAGAKVALTENVTLSGDYFLFVNKRSTLNAGMGTLTWRY